MTTDNRRCKWRRRLCRYFGEHGHSHLCGRCQMWCHRNRYCQIKHALCSNSSMTPALRHPGLWGQMLNLLCGSIRELDLHVQQYIWQTILCGPAPYVESCSESEPSELLDYIDMNMQTEYPPRNAPSSGSFGCWTYGADHRAWCHDTMTVSGTPEYYSLSLLFWDRSRSSGLLMGHSGLEGGSFMLFRVRGSLRKGKPA